MITIGETMGNKFTAFTLAEVLITLGIIGVVAALTLPSLIANYRKNVLATQFKKSVSIISQAILLTKTEIGIENFADYCTSLDTDNSSYTNVNECYNAFEKNFVKIANRRDQASNVSMIYDIDRSNETIKTYNGKQILTYSALAGPAEAIFLVQVMPDGSFFNMHIDEGTLYIGADINGNKRPNQFGHDIFLFVLDKKKDTLTYYKPENLSDEDLENGDYEYEYQKERKGNPCNLTSNQKANGIGCAYYALRDECPDSPGKSYFNCLP